jgi:ATP-dependent DNA helicase RecQ
MLENAIQVLKKYYGYTSFRKGQEKIIESILSSKDTFAIMPTGAGKSICFQIPALLMEGVTIVISPLISLMKDQVDTLCSMGIPASYINSSLEGFEVQQRIMQTITGEIKILYIAPERLESEQFCSMLAGLKISFIAIDEAHCVSQWGHDFRPSYVQVSRMIKRLDERPVVAAFTATATEEVKEDVVRLLELKSPEIFISGFDRENLSFSVIRGDNKRDFILKYIEDNKDKTGVIYAATRKEVDNLCELLNKKGYKAGRYHAGLSDEERTRAQEDFIYDNSNIIVATNAFGMGIDKSNVRYVIHYNMPRTMEAYYQEAGRAGRDGEPSECILLFSAQDVLLQKFLIEQSVVSPDRKLMEYKRLQIVVDYCHTPKCLRKYILEYFGERDVKDNCGNCSTCLDDSELSDITIEAQKIFSCVYRVNQNYGVSLVADVLKGSKNKKVTDLGFNALSTYGLMKEYTVKEIKDMINILVADEYLVFAGMEFPILRLKEKAVMVLKGNERVMQRVQKKKTKKVEDNTLFGLLKSLRKSISEREKVPPYIVFADSTLREMSEACPTNEYELLEIKGVGEVKLQRYGEDFLSVIRDYKSEQLG